MILKKRALSTICRRHGLLFNAPGGMHSSCWTWAAWRLWSQPGWAQHTRKTQNLFVCSASTELPPSPRPGARCCLSCTALAIPSLELLESAQPQPQTPLKSRAKNKNCAPCNGMCFAPKYTVFKLINNRLIANEGQCFPCFLCTLHYKLSAQLSSQKVQISFPGGNTGTGRSLGVSDTPVSLPLHLHLQIL